MNMNGSAIRVGTVGRRPASYRVLSPEETIKPNGISTLSVDANALSLRTSTNALLQFVDPEHFLRLRQFIKRVNLAKDQYLYQQDDEIDVIYFPETAVVSEFQILEDGRTIEVGMIGNEGAVGIASAFNLCRAANCMQVCVPGNALSIPRDVFEREVMSDRRLQATLHNYINGQIRQLSQRVVCNTFHSVEQRFCSWLLTLHKRSCRDKFKLTHEHVARVLGVHRPSVTCIAQTLRDKKLIDYGRARLVICNRPGLESVACRCSADLPGPLTEH